MRLILSRKGFDSKNGGVASPIFPDGRLLSLPIPSSKSRTAFDDIGQPGQLGTIVESLTNGKVKASDRAHLDPDLDPLSLRRLPHWLPGFGQRGHSQSHLVNCGVGVGDIFMFFGWFRQVEQSAGGSWQFARGTPHIHVLFGWLQIGEVLQIPSDPTQLLKIRPWLSDHPHVQNPGGRGNTIYVAAEHLSLNSVRDRQYPGAAIFPRFHLKLKLTKSGQTSRTLWSLPSWFYPTSGRTPLSHHSNLMVWSMEGGDVELQSAKIGQEFVLNCDEYPEAILWLADLITKCGEPQQLEPDTTKKGSA